jgi:hypothetical protein
MTKNENSWRWNFLDAHVSVFMVIVELGLLTFQVPTTYTRPSLRGAGKEIALFVPLVEWGHESRIIKNKLKKIRIFTIPTVVKNKKIPFLGTSINK